MLGGLTCLVAFQLAGEVTPRVLALPVPGPVIGMLFLLAGLVIMGGVPESLRTTGTGWISCGSTTRP
jgi:holin-like protein